MATNTYTAIATQTLASAASSVTFSSIPSGYTDLQIVISATASGLVNGRLQVNGDTSSGLYSTTVLYGTGSSAASTRQSGQNSIWLDNTDTGSNTNVTTISLMSYSNATTYKTCLVRGSAASTQVDAHVGLWRNTNAITSITLFPSSGTYSAGSTFSLYGIAAAVNSSSTTTPPVSGYSLWLDGADDSSFTYSSGTLVSQWSDKSGNSRHFTQATTANQPNRISTIRQNNYPVVQFWQGGADTARWLEKTSYDWAGSDNTVFIVMKGNTATGSYQSAFAAKTSSGLSYAITGASTYQYAIFKNGVAPYAYNLIPTVGTADVAVWKSGAIAGGSVTTAFYKNGTAASSTQTITGLSTSTTAQVGANNTAESLYGYICEVLVYPSQLSDGDRNSVEAYLKSKWGIS